MKKILLSVCVVAMGLTVTAQQLKTNGYLPSNAPILKEASNEIVKPITPSLRSAATTIFSEDFDGGAGQFTIFTDPGSPVSWEHTTVGMVGAYPSPALQSTTAGNGWMKADSDAYGSQGGAQEYTELISPVIDCSMYPNVILQFEQQFRRWQADTCIVMTSNDGGATWTGKHYINSTIDANGNPHGFGDVVAGSYVEIFNDTDADFGLYVVRDVDDKSNMIPGYWIFTVDFIKSNRLPSRANGLARFKFFEAPEVAIGPTPAYIRTGSLNLDTPVDNSNLNPSPDRKTLVALNRHDYVNNNGDFYIQDTRYFRISKDVFEAAFPGGINNYTFMPGQMVYYGTEHRQVATPMPMNMGAFLAISFRYEDGRYYEIEVSGMASENYHYKYPKNKYIEDSIYDHFLSFGCFWRKS